MENEKDLESGASGTGTLDDPREPSDEVGGTDLNDEQLAGISGGSGFPTNGGTGDNPTTPSPSPPPGS